MKLLLLFQAVVAAVSNTANTADTLKLRSVPVYRNTVDPRSQIFSRFDGIHEGMNSMISVELHLNTSRPCVRLDNFKQITHIKCTDSSSMVIQFDSKKSVSLAYSEWSQTKDLALLLGHEHGCNGGDVAAFSVIKIYTRYSSMHVRVSPLKREEVVENWTAKITHLPQDESLVKRDFTLNKAIAMDFNLDRAFNRTENPLFKLFDHHVLHCHNCSTRGALGFQMVVEGKYLDIKGYKISLDGRFSANMDLKIGLLPGDEIFAVKERIIEIPLTPFDIPGVFRLGPSLQLEASVIVYADTEVSINFGFDVDLPMDFEIASENLRTAPVSRSTLQPSFNHHPFNITKFKPMPTYIGTHIQLNPELNFGLKIFGREIFAIKVSIVNQLGMIDRYVSKCSNQSSLEIFHRHKLATSLYPSPETKFTFVQLDTQRIPISCRNCNCPLDIARANPDLIPFPDRRFLSAFFKMEQQ